jgi:hypothetical protein
MCGRFTAITKSGNVTVADTWNEDLLAEIIGNAVEEYAREFDAEQAVRGVDSLTENELLGRIRKSLIQREILVAEEERYPDAWCVDRLNEGRRCDLVLLPSNAASDLRGKADWCSAGYWLEAKRLAQFLESGPNWWYEQSLLQTVSQDIYKLATDSSIFSPESF